MRRTLSCALVIVAALAIRGGTSVSARMSPSVLMVYGGTLREPVVFIQYTQAVVDTYVAFWNGRSSPLEPRHVTDRPYFNVAIFWIPYPTVNGQANPEKFIRTLKPEQAHQHGRLYVATREAGAASVSTDYPKAGPLQPIPHEVSQFKYGTWLTDADIEAAQRLGITLSRK